MLFRPNSSSGVPIYLQLMEQVKHGLETGALRAGEQLPGIRPLAEELVINPNAVARAYRGLEQEGVIALRSGSEAGLLFTKAFTGRSRAQGSRPSEDLALANSRLAAQMAAEAASRVDR